MSDHARIVGGRATYAASVELRGMSRGVPLISS
jgi:hypothetical protein